MALSPRAGRWLGILRKKAQAIWLKHHQSALLWNYGASATQDLGTYSPPVGRLRTFVVLLSNNWELENLSNFLLWTSYHMRCMYQPSSITNILITHLPFPALPSKRKRRYLKFYRTPKVYLKMSKGARNLSEK